MALAWAEKLSVGNAIIDSEHRNLIRMVSELILAVRKKDCATLDEVFDQLESSLLIHCANEEFFARAIGFDFSAHRTAQQFALKELQYIRDEWVGKQGVWSGQAIEHFSNAMKRWMIDEHILKLDMLMKPALQAQGYDFMPGG